MSVDAPELTVARKTTSTRIPTDLVNMVNVVASFQNRSAVDVWDDLARAIVSRAYKAEVAKAAKANEKKAE